METEWHGRRVRALLTIGRLLSQLGEFDCAIELLKKALELKPNLVEACVELGIVFGRTEDYEEMVKTFRGAIRIDQRAVRTAICKYPEDDDLLNQILYPSGTHAETQIVTQAWEPPIEVKEAGALIDLGIHYLAVGRDKDAVAALERSLELDTVSWVPMVILSVAYLLLETYAGAQMGDVKKSVLWELDTRLAAHLFRSQ